MKREKTEVKTRSKQEVKHNNKLGRASNKWQENSRDKLQCRKRRRHREDRRKQMEKQKERYQYIYHYFLND